MKQIVLIVMMFVGTNYAFARESIAKYILDGDIVVYSPNIPQSTQLWDIIVKKTKGIEAGNTMDRLDFRIKQRLSANMFTEDGATYLGIDYYGGMAYVQLSSGINYIIFTVANEGLLRSRLNSLDDPMPYRIEEKFVIFSSSREILDYYEFRGITQLPIFNQVAKELKLTWNKNLIWIDSASFRRNASVFSMGDKMIGTFNVVGNKIMLDMVTVYEDPEISKLLIDSMKVKPVQNFTMLDYEYGEPGVVGNMYVDISSFYSMMNKIDSADYLFLVSLFRQLDEYGIDLQRDVLSYLKGRLSYALRAFDMEKKKFDFNISSEIANKEALRESIRRIVILSEERGMKIQYKNLFTQQFYGWNFKGHMLWIGIVENHLIISSDEANLVKLVQNIYQDRSGFLATLPTSMNRLIKNKTIGGQVLIKNPTFAQNFNMMGSFFSRAFLLALKQIEWEFYLINNGNMTGRRDIVNFDFYE